MKTLWLGDLCPTEQTAELFREKNVELLFSDTVPLYQNRDFTFVNLECALTDHDGAIAKFGPALKAPRETAEVLKSLHVNLCGLSNNHVFDYGVRGARDTIAALKENGLAYTGFGENTTDARRNYTVERNGERICVIAVCEHEYSYALENRMGARAYDPYDTMEDIRAASADHDRVIVVYHGGKEQCEYPSPRLRKLCRAMVCNGADLVLCQHSHCIGTYECFEGAHIVYGQGNFHFVQDTRNPQWHTGLAIAYDTVSAQLEFYPVCVTPTGIRLANSEERDEILQAFRRRSQTLGSDAWREGWHAFCKASEQSYVKVIAEACTEGATERQNAKFAHYLDCEAHTDVWRELFPTYNQTNEQ